MEAPKCWSCRRTCPGKDDTGPSNPGRAAEDEAPEERAPKSSPAGLCPSCPKCVCWKECSQLGAGAQCFKLLETEQNYLKDMKSDNYLGHNVLVLYVLGQCKK